MPQELNTMAHNASAVALVAPARSEIWPRTILPAARAASYAEATPAANTPE